jgi:hypothetical protein
MKDADRHELERMIAQAGCKAYLATLVNCGSMPIRAE